MYGYNNIFWLSGNVVIISYYVLLLVPGWQEPIRNAPASHEYESKWAPVVILGTSRVH